MDSYSFSLAATDDIPEIVAIYHSLIGTPGCTWSLDYPNTETAWSDIESGSLYVLKDNGTIIAAASAGPFDELGHLSWSPQNPCELARLGVAPGMQKRGIGTIILQNVITAAKERGFDGIRMLVSKTNHSALRLYDKNGFERCGEAFMFDIHFYRYQMKFD
jgi:ribosomal protein S18 acetylase RimI-like enzyme